MFKAVVLGAITLRVLNALGLALHRYAAVQYVDQSGK